MDTPKVYILLMVGLLLQACARNVSQGSGEKMTTYSEDLSATRPLIEVEREEVEEEKDTAGDALAFESDSPSSENSRIKEALGKISSYNQNMKEAPGYRIQVFSGNSRSEFESAKSYVMQHFPELELYESYSQPTYRLKVGDFMKRMDAERYYNALLGRFSSGKITNETIDVQKGFSIN